MIANKKPAFTLIELLVVIAIIGILSGIVITNLNSARNKGQDTAIKAQAAQLKNTAAVYYDNNNYGYSSSTVSAIIHTTCPTSSSGTFANTFFASSESLQAIAGITKNSGTTSNCALGSSSVGGSQSWAMSTKLRNPNSSGAVNYWCVDSSGSAKESTNANASAVITGTGEVVCP